MKVENPRYALRNGGLPVEMEAVFHSNVPLFRKSINIPYMFLWFNL